MQSKLFASLAASVALAAAPLTASAQNCDGDGNGGVTTAPTVISSNVTSDTTWPTHVVLDAPIFVKDGATLTILPGSVVRGQPRSSAVMAGMVAGSPGAIVVTQTGRLVADASATNPIIMTTAAVDNDNDGVPDDDDGNGFEDSWAPGDDFYDDD